MNSYILDTSVILTYIENEEGVKEVDGLLLQALEDKLISLFQLSVTLKSITSILENRARKLPMIG